MRAPFGLFRECLKAVKKRFVYNFLTHVSGNGRRWESKWSTQDLKCVYFQHFVAYFWWFHLASCCGIFRVSSSFRSEDGSSSTVWSFSILIGLSLKLKRCRFNGLPSWWVPDCSSWSVSIGLMRFDDRPMTTKYAEDLNNLQHNVFFRLAACVWSS